LLLASTDFAGQLALAHATRGSELADSILEHKHKYVSNTYLCQEKFSIVRSTNTRQRRGKPGSSC
jgi:hypothetical protein